MSDDAGVIKVADDLALIQTVDFFTPIVDDPYTFGQIAAANALSDVYAMGGKPHTAMNMVCFPLKEMGPEILYQILAGGLDKIRQAGALLVGGHSVEDPEIKYGLAVTGLVHPDKVITNAQARVGQALVLTKPLGVGILVTGLKAKLAPPGSEARMIEIMTALNDQAAEAMIAAGVEAATDITGFGLLGHGLEMARASGVELLFESSRVPILEGVIDLARMGLMPGGSRRNRDFCAASIIIEEGVDKFLVDVLADAQTSGGLLMAVAPDRLEGLMDDLASKGVEATTVGRVSDQAAGRIRVV